MKREQAFECGGCGCEERWLLHNVRHRGVYRRLCTSCVLKFHPGSFCPICFEFYEEPPPPRERVMCLKCSSISHLACVGADAASRFVCPTCVKPSLLFFNIGPSSKSKDGDGGQVPAEAQRSIDQKSAKVLLTAARIAVISMSKAATTAKVEAERRIKEAVLAKKRAREALDRIASLMAKEKEREIEKASMGSPGSSSVVEQKKKHKPNNNGGVAAAVAAQRRIQNHLRADGIDKSGVFSASLESSGSRIKERRGKFLDSNAVTGLNRNGVSVEEKDRQKLLSASDMGHQQTQSSAVLKEKERSTTLPPLQNHSLRGEENNELIPGPPVSAQQHPKNNHASVEERSSKEFASSSMVPNLIHSSQDMLASNKKSGVTLQGSVDAAS